MKSTFCSLAVACMTALGPAGTSLATPTELPATQADKRLPKATVTGQHIKVGPGRLSFNAKGALKPSKLNGQLIDALAELLKSRKDLSRVRVEGHGAPDGRPKY